MYGPDGVRLGEWGPGWDAQGKGWEKGWEGKGWEEYGKGQNSQQEPWMDVRGQWHQGKGSD
jgi:hypothetical protein